MSFAVIARFAAGSPGWRTGRARTRSGVGEGEPGSRNGIVPIWRSRPWFYCATICWQC